MNETNFFRYVALPVTVLGLGWFFYWCFSDGHHLGIALLWFFVLGIIVITFFYVILPILMLFTGVAYVITAVTYTLRSLFMGSKPDRDKK